MGAYFIKDFGIGDKAPIKLKMIDTETAICNECGGEVKPDPQFSQQWKCSCGKSFLKLQER
jgi:hypothetical protein